MATSKNKSGRRAIKDQKAPLKEYLCPYCNQTKKETEFYISTDPLVMTGKTSMCKECAEKIARNYDPITGTYGDCTKQSILEALERLDKPYIDSLYTASYMEFNNPDAQKKRSTLFGTYIKNVGMQQYKTMRWKDGDLFATYRTRAEAEVLPIEKQIDNGMISKDQEIYETYKKNRESVIHLLGYDPFSEEAEIDKPLLYSQLVGYLDMGGDNEDMMRNSSAITIVRGFLQQAKLDDMIAKAMRNVAADNKTGEIKALLDSKQKISGTISQLAEQSCLSLKHNKNSSKGENTWTGKIKKLKDLDLREAEVNGFDIGTCRGMQQVLELSDASIMKQLRMDESEWSDMVAEQRKLLIDVQNERDIYKEINRLLLRENLDLRDTLSEMDLLDQTNLQNLKELFSVFSDATSSDQEEDTGE